VEGRILLLGVLLLALELELPLRERWVEALALMREVGWRVSLGV
jgi:hypothetical protein